MYNEIEAEANLVLEQLTFLLSNSIYRHYKDCAAASHLEKSYKGKLEEMKQAPFLTIPKRRFEVLMTQRHVLLLGRYVDLRYLVGRHVNDLVRSDLDLAIRRLESSSCCCLPELRTALEVVRLCHNSLTESNLLDLDSYADLFGEVDNTIFPSTTVEGHSRIATFVAKSVEEDLIKNYTYNVFTQRFVSSPVPMTAPACADSVRLTFTQEYCMSSEALRVFRDMAIALYCCCLMSCGLVH